MTTPSLSIRSPLTPDELVDHINGYVEVAQSFSPDPLPEDMANRMLHRLTTLPGYREEQIRSAYRNGEQLGGYRISERLLLVGAAQLATGCIGGVYTRAEARNQGVATALMHDAIAYAQMHEYALLLLNGIPKFYHRYGFCDVYGPVYARAGSSGHPGIAGEPLHGASGCPGGCSRLARAL
jgi:predicted N-acetyltransferase YhbS